MIVSRRQFLGAAGLAAGALLLPRTTRSLRAAVPATLPSNDPAPLYRFILLGDTHYDLPEHHDMDWVTANMSKDLSQIRGYCDVSKNHTPALFSRIRDLIKTSAVPISFVLHVGDLVEGLCGSYALHSRQFEDAFALIEQSRFGVPFLMAKGNHDITGPGAADAYDKVLLPWLSRQAGSPLTRAAFSHRHDKDLFLFFDSYKPDLDWLESQLKAHADARHTFFVIHQPVVPYNDRVDWIVFSKPDAQPRRQKLLNLLGSRRAIVLSGHLHKYSLLERDTPDAGRFSQLAVCSVVRDDHARPREERQGLDAFTDELLALEPNFEPATRDQRKTFLADERPAIHSFQYADLPGFAIIDVHESAVHCTLYGGLDPTPYRSLPIHPSPA